MRNNSLLVVGYSFGDLYINQVLERMDLIYGNEKRIVLIDYWNLLVDDNVINGIPEGEERGAYVKEMMIQKVLGDEISDSLGTFLCRMTGSGDFREAISSFVNYDRTGPMISNNGCLMLFIGGFKKASVYKNEIYEFLNS